MESIEKIIGSQLKTNSKIIIKQKEGKGVFPSHWRTAPTTTRTNKKNNK